jgi:phosphatidylserine/phosphatidylglycerophosphate/cardiolipin synthase-like enzyme
MLDGPIRLDLRIQTPHGAPVSGADVRITGQGVVCTGAEVEAAPGDYRAALPISGDYILFVERVGKAGGFDHRTLRTTLFYAGQGEVPSLRTLNRGDTRASEIAGVTLIGERHFRLDVVLDYLWFTPIGTPPREGNAVRLLPDGELGWGAVADALAGARKRVHVTTWIYQETTELRRPDPLAEPEAREPFTIQENLRELAERGVTVRLLLWDAPFLEPPADTRKAGRDGGDHFEVLQQENPTDRRLLNDDEHPLLNSLLGGFKVGSYHQKTAIIDGVLGYCGGMNLKENDWDSRLHQVFDPRRCRFSRPRSFREQVAEFLHPTDHAPRHDFIAELRGPAVVDLERNFQERWHYLIDKAEDWSDNASRFKLPAAAPACGPTQVQVVRTMPEPWDERGIQDVYLRAVGAARRLIYIEDQYFRSVQLSDAIASQVRKFPDLRVVVVTKESEARGVGSGGWTHECVERIRERQPGFQLFALKVSGVDREGRRSLVEVDVHAKLMIVDDWFMTVGSCNVNDRGFEYEGEINLAVVDAPLVAAARLDLWREHLADDPRLSGDIDGDWAVWREVAAANRHYTEAAVHDPKGNVHPFETRADRRAFTGYDIM